MIKIVEIHGKPIASGQTVSIDHVTQEINLTLRSFNGVDPETIKKHLQKFWEVLEIKQVNSTQYVRAGVLDF